MKQPKKEREGRLDRNKLFEQGPVLLFSIDIRNPNNPVVTFATPNLYTHLGYMPEDVINGKVSLKDIIHPDDYSRFTKRIFLSFENKEINNLNTNYRLIKKNGEIRYMRTYSFIERDSRQNPLFFHGYIMDVHEQELYKRQLEQVIEGANLGYWVWNVKTGHHEVNDIWLDMLGLSREDIKNDITDWSDRLHPDDKKKILPIVEEHIKNGTIFVGEFRMRHKNGSWVWIQSSGGVVEYSHESGEPLLMCGTHQNISDRKKTEKKIKFMAFHDVLTGLPNRTLLFDRIKQALYHAKRSRESNALIFIDLDNFKHINDSLGHKIGDMLLKRVASRLKKCVRSEDTVARLGGDEFVILLTGLDINRADEYALYVANKIMNSLKRAFKINNQTLHTSSSIGIALFPVINKLECCTPVEVLKRADTAMYHAKSEGKGTIRFFDEELNKKAQRRLKMDIGMRNALKKREFDVFYQPIVEIKSGRTIGLEALIRWEPNNEVFHPSEFIPIAEESSLILEISEFVIKEVCKDLKNGKIFKLFPDLKSISINLSTNLFKIEEFENKITKILQQKCINPSMLNFELTESVFINNYQNIIDKILKFKKMGIKFSIDDFGTGFSSLTYLKKLPIDYIKIDKSFINEINIDEDNAKIVEAIIDISKHFGLKVVAEGVETAEQLKFLKKSRCDYCQGFLFSKPSDLDSFSYDNENMKMAKEIIET
ncbi:GGDEF and EAL domain-containing protein [Nitrosophilus alvini]|uniref:bifunctional diguanylate cyclase/phosphodiesterase n=1 Tax=Nitrosophilus alvini TaxID=2714855 RepID=UPI001909995C|nr:GGDEF and EAL domain-containing protein [Nitrosophilus alvini]